MPEEEWLLPVGALEKLNYVSPKSSFRKLRLFACACFAAVDIPLCEAEESQIDFGEQAAESPNTCFGINMRFEWLAWREANNKPTGGTQLPCIHDDPLSAAEESLFDSASLVAAVLDCPATGHLYAEKITSRLRSLVWDLFGNPFRPVEIRKKCRRCAGVGRYKTVVYVGDGKSGRMDRHCQACRGVGWFQPDWRSSRVISLAQPAYDERLPSRELDTARLFVLSDAMEEEADASLDIRLLEHLRSPGPHYRGCWALDLILGKE
ncbi:MAG: hypothetical protein E6G97_18310 [Alphaproteobacteria bacterium]|nr:MAG: hypothetical protein E6G97_18310 [Alphaproteobacteria bacterium]